MRKYFCQNKFPLNVFKKVIAVKLDSEFNPTIILTTVPKKKLFMLNHTMNKAMKLELIVFINKFYPQVNSNIIFTNNHSVQNFFKFMDIIPEVVKSKVVYTYCTQCSESYVGETTRHFHNLVSKHRGLSPRAGVPIRAVPKSNVCNIF